MQSILDARRARLGLTLIALSIVAALVPSWAQAGDVPAHRPPTLLTTDQPLELGVGIARADGSQRVRALQRRLARLGHRPGPVDGRFGPQTQAAVTRFQRAQGLLTDGVAGPRTLARLRAPDAGWPAGWSAGAVARGTGFRRPGGSRRVREVQRDLRRLGYSPGPVDGLYGPRTERAVRRFKVARQLGATGVVDVRALRVLRRSNRPVAPANSQVAQGPGAVRQGDAVSPSRSRPGDSIDPVVVGTAIAGALLLLLTVGLLLGKIHSP
jgi:peptidoglycan hydrolase-like protein with peptidoglycan-binding domain